MAFEKTRPEISIVRAMWWVKSFERMMKFKNLAVHTHCVSQITIASKINKKRKKYEIKFKEAS